MKFLCIKAVTCIIVMSVSFIVMADALTDLPISNINGMDCYVYEVQPKETVFTLCNKFGITRDELQRYNPSVVDGLKAYQKLIFPYAVFNKNGIPQTYKAQKGDTSYGISKKFNLTIDKFYELNPAARDGIHTGQILIVSDSNENSISRGRTATVSEPERVKHVIAEHESLYRIAKENNTTVDSILAMNPDLDPLDYKAGTEISLPIAKQVNGDIIVTSKKNPNTYIVKNGDTFYGIARSYGLTSEQLRAANPGVISLKEGMSIVIPQECNEKVENANVDNPALESETLNDVCDTISIALALPFMLDQKERSRQAKLYTEFYKGVLLAVDSMRNCGKPIKIMAFDTRGTTGGVLDVLSEPELKSARVIVAPDNADHLTMIAEFGRTNNIAVMNLFVVKDTLQVSNPVLMQANISHDTMYRKAIEYVKSAMTTRTPVILRRTDGADDKIDLVEKIKTDYAHRGVSCMEIEYTQALSDTDMECLSPTGNYLFIPISSKQSELNKVLPAIVKWKENANDHSQVALFGYPEWVTFRGETLTNMYKADTFVFSRFYTAPDEEWSKDVDNAFRKWYGCNMAAFVPRQGLFGFDTGMYLIRALMSNGGDFERYTPAYDGVQNGFYFIHDGDGWVNNEMYILNYRPGEFIVKSCL